MTPETKPPLKIHVQTTYIVTIDENKIKNIHRLINLIKDQTFNFEKKLEKQKLHRDFSRYYPSDLDIEKF